MKKSFAADVACFGQCGQGFAESVWLFSPWRPLQPGRLHTHAPPSRTALYSGLTVRKLNDAVVADDADELKIRSPSSPAESPRRVT